MEPKDLQLLVDAIQTEFGDPERLRTWLTQRVPNENVFNILLGATFETQVRAMIEWAQSRGRDIEVFQLLADYPPRAGGILPGLIHFVTAGRASPGGRAVPPIAAHRDWFVTKRPFANRVKLRSALETLDRAEVGADSILVIDGPELSGKSHSIRLAARCAPPHRFIPVDVSDWGSNTLDAADLARAIYPTTSADFPAYDPTKENAAVPRLLTWLKGKLGEGPQTWILLDHCKRANLTEGAANLLSLLVASVDSGFLPNVRLIIADIDQARLPRTLKGRSRWDTADLPDRDAVKDWCRTLAHHLNKSCTDAEIDAWAVEVFQGFADMPPPRTELASVLESRLNAVFGRIRDRQS